jgi:Domain of unknown function (DUF4136)
MEEPMTLKRFGLPFAALIVAFLYCSIGFSQDVKYNYLPGTNFSQYKTYKWVSIPGGAHPDQITDTEIKQDIDAQLAQKGLTKTDADTADLAVAYQVAIDQEKQWNAWGGGLGGLRFGGMGSATSSTISNGTLVFDIYDVATKKQIWTGDATKTLNPSKDPQKNMANLQKGIAKLLKNYPPPSK